MFHNYVKLPEGTGDIMGLQLITGISPRIHGESDWTDRAFIGGISQTGDGSFSRLKYVAMN